ncbi:hypothetical protein M5K25_020735 [Dendrobium thyrsiflorum]|uniref:Uncharacterized protein n=1 Tax=Dendrobium thyrsiflorum TaxID=117978 RepID=A0ABD0UAS2_DENTH
MQLVTFRNKKDIGGGVAGDSGGLQQAIDDDGGLQEATEARVVVVGGGRRWLVVANGGNEGKPDQDPMVPSSRVFVASRSGSLQATAGARTGETCESVELRCLLRAYVWRGFGELVEDLESILYRVWRAINID